MKSLIKELNEKKSKLALGGGPKKLEKQHSLGKLSARERIEKLLDLNSFKEIDQFVHHRSTFMGMDEVEAPGDGVVTGYGRINGRVVFAFSQDFTVMGGTVGEAHADKIVRIVDLAGKSGAPIIGLNDSGGARIQEGFDAQGGYSRIFHKNVQYSGVIPQLSVILGPCAGGAVYSPALTDFVFMTEGISYMFLTGPKVIKESTGEEIGVYDLGGAKVHSSKTGVAHFYSSSEYDCFEVIRRLLTFLPFNNREKPPIVLGEDPVERKSEKLLEIVPTNPRKPYNMVEVISEILDDRDFLEVHKRWARNIVVGFGRLRGNTVGVIGNQPRILAGALDIDAADKAARFIRFCDAFNIPLVTFVDTPAFLPGKSQEFSGIIRHGAKLLFAYSEATVPKITVIVRKAYGGGYVAMCPRDAGADRVFAWPTAEIAMMSAESATKILFGKDLSESDDSRNSEKKKIDEFRKQFCNPYAAATRGQIDTIIDPAETRENLISCLESILDKQEQRPWRKHGNIPL